MEFIGKRQRAAALQSRLRRRNRIGLFKFHFPLLASALKNQRTSPYPLFVPTLRVLEIVREAGEYK
jgi:hypothetical protein